MVDQRAADVVPELQQQVGPDRDRARALARVVHVLRRVAHPHGRRVEHLARARRRGAVISSAWIVSVSSGRCAPCCSRLAIGIITTSFSLQIRADVDGRQLAEVVRREFQTEISSCVGSTARSTHPDIIIFSQNLTTRGDARHCPSSTSCGARRRPCRPTRPSALRCARDWSWPALFKDAGGPPLAARRGRARDERRGGGRDAAPRHRARRARRAARRRLGRHGRRRPVRRRHRARRQRDEPDRRDRRGVADRDGRGRASTAARSSRPSTSAASPSRTSRPPPSGPRSAATSPPAAPACSPRATARSRTSSSRCASSRRPARSSTRCRSRATPSGRS